jgi:hypothetical protein
MMQEKSSGKPFFRKAVGMMLAAGLLAVPLSFAPAALPSEMVTVAEASSYVDSGDVVLVGTFQQQFGADGNWAPWDGTTIMHRSGSHKYVYRGWLPKGYYEYKIKPSPCSGARKRGMPVASPSGDRVLQKAFPVRGGAQARDAGGIPVRGPRSTKAFPVIGEGGPRSGG